MMHGREKSDLAIVVMTPTNKAGQPAAVIADIDGGEEAAAEISAKFGSNSTHNLPCDVSDEGQVRNLIAGAIERLGKIDILVNNAALFAALNFTLVQDIEVDLWDRVFAVNVRGPFLLTKHVAPHMIARNYGKIINIGLARYVALYRIQGRNRDLHPHALA